jgi:hypothetical protein
VLVGAEPAAATHWLVRKPGWSTARYHPKSRQWAWVSVSGVPPLTCLPRRRMTISAPVPLFGSLGLSWVMAKRRVP